jgi:hypothetical protein
MGCELRLVFQKRNLILLFYAKGYLPTQKTPGGGKDNDENTWDHFGLLPAGKSEKSRVSLDTEPFKPATTCWQGHTTWSREQIESKGVCSRHIARRESPRTKGFLTIFYRERAHQ